MSSDTAFLSDLGISRDQSASGKKLGAMPQDEFVGPLTGLEPARANEHPKGVIAKRGVTPGTPGA
jgi:hypothetical protein